LFQWLRPAEVCRPAQGSSGKAPRQAINCCFWLAVQHRWLPGKSVWPPRSQANLPATTAAQSAKLVKYVKQLRRNTRPKTTKPTKTPQTKKHKTLIYKDFFKCASFGSFLF
jgi:hypothetical protein